jgi:hypothetical protein
MSEAGRELEATTRIVVRAGAIDRFAALRAAFAPDGVQVVWDRRQGDRRRPAVDPAPGTERRRSDRRSTVPPSWVLLDFLVVPAPSPAS